jgi:hypothetical protein
LTEADIWRRLQPSCAAQIGGRNSTAVIRGRELLMAEAHAYVLAIIAPDRKNVRHMICAGCSGPLSVFMEKRLLK